MPAIVNISSECLSVSISTRGAELMSVKKGDTELLWQGDPAFWTGRAPLLFPVCGALRDDKYVFNGKEYKLPKHGFTRGSEFTAEVVEPARAVFLLKSNEETLKMYPFEFELRVIYEVAESKLRVTYLVKNLGDEDMYYSIGAHEAYACPEGIEEYSVIFDECEDLDAARLDGVLIGTATKSLGKCTRELQLKNEYFKEDALIFLNLKSRRVTLRNRNSGREVKLDFNGFNYFLIWMKPGAGYVCLEPWRGITDFYNSNYDFRTKPGINSIGAGETDVSVHTIEF